MSRRWTEEEAKAPADLRLAVPALAVWGGCLVALWAPAVAAWSAGVAVGCLGAYGLAARRGQVHSAAVAVALVCFLAAMLVATLRLTSAAHDPLVVAGRTGQWVTVDAVAVAEPVPVTGGFGPSGGDAEPAQRWRLGLRAASAVVDGARVTCGARITVFADGPQWGAVRTGVTIRLRGAVRPDDFGPVPAVAIRARGDPEWVAPAGLLTRGATAARDRLAASAEVLDADRAGLLRGLVVGDTAGISPELSADAKTTGLTHLVAVSGSHMAVVAAVVLLLLRRFGPRVSGVGVALAFGALVIVVGPAPSVMRAVVMGLIAVLAAVIGRSRSALSALSATVFGLLLVDPFLAVNAGFALSVQATTGLILVAPILIRAMERRRVPRGWAMLLAVPIAAHLVTIPVITAISGSISLAAIPANVAVTPVIPFALVIGVACLVSGTAWPALGELLARADGPLLGWITGTAHRLARWPWAAMPWPASPVGVMAITAVLLAGLVVFRFRTLRAVAVAGTVGAVCVLAAAHAVHVGWPGPNWLITMCDVGQGDAIVLSTDRPGEGVVVDTGPEPAAVDGCLDRLGITTIALVVVTHLHADHVDGLSGAMAGRTVEAVAVGPDRSSPTALAHITAQARERAIPLTDVGVGDEWQVHGLRLEVLGPTREFHGTQSDANNESVVMRATHRGVRMLLTGDIERPAQQALLDAGVDLTADVLKQPHHGSSKLLAGFVAAVSADVAIIGVGAGNDYGHPAPSALRRDRDSGIHAILRTDIDGDVQILVTDSGLSSITSRPGKAGTILE